MAKTNLTPAAWSTDNISTQAPQVKGQASTLQPLFDKSSVDIKDYNNNTLITELNGDGGANKIGFDSNILISDNVGDAIEEIRVLTATAQSTATTANTTANTATVNLDISRLAKGTTGNGNSFFVDTAGTFDRTKDGNIITFIPHLSNSGTITLSEDGNAGKLIKKADGAGYIDLLAGDIRQGVPTTAVWSVGSDFFILRPSGGGAAVSVKSVQRGSTLVDSFQFEEFVSINAVDLTRSIIKVSYNGGQNAIIKEHAFSAQFTANNEIRIAYLGVLGDVVHWEVIEFDNVKSLQSGATSFSSTTDTAKNLTISAVNLSKSITFFSYRSTDTRTLIDISGKLTSSTNFQFIKAAASLSGSTTIEWFVVEFF